ncbi:hypothetical protein NDU88_007385 [Pleurodeles waltl]|uniref:Uncharacterized protein n=1 Tax=Pleurodeles waltl TaxID=8319 RepID=A0AAV7SSE1_PLEWA|nr:hypothetical protein NDU88_007385 [Pleurodeles waltl]
MAYEGAALSYRALRLLGANPVVLGPRVSPQVPDPSAPRSEGPPGESPSRGPGRLSRRFAAQPRLWGRTPLSPRERRSPDPAAPGITLDDILIVVDPTNWRAARWGNGIHACPQL